MHAPLPHGLGSHRRLLLFFLLLLPSVQPAAQLQHVLLVAIAGLRWAAPQEIFLGRVLSRGILLLVVLVASALAGASDGAF